MTESHTTSPDDDLATREDDKIDFSTIGENDLVIELDSELDSQYSLFDEMRALRNRILVLRQRALIDIDDIVEQVRHERDEEILSASPADSTGRYHDS